MATSIQATIQLRSQDLKAYLSLTLHRAMEKPTLKKSQAYDEALAAHAKSSFNHSAERCIRLVGMINESGALSTI